MTGRRAASALVAVPEGGFRAVWFDPYSGVVTGDTPFITVGRFINILHTNLFLPAIGRYVVNAFGLLMLISIVTGLIIYLRRIKRAAAELLVGSRLAAALRKVWHWVKP